MNSSICRGLSLLISMHPGKRGFLKESIDQQFIWVEEPIKIKLVFVTPPLVVAVKCIAMGEEIR